MNKLKALSVSAALFAAGCATTEIVGYSVREMKEKADALEFRASNGVVLPYRMYVSEMRSKSPLVVFLHGSGERGTDNEAQLSYGINHIARFVDDNAENATVVAPQCPPDRYWKSPDVMDALREFVEDRSELGYVDRSRVYVTGFSMGGEGAWVFGLRNPGLVSTIVPLCGGPLATDPYDFSDVTEGMHGVNVWAFNYFDDKVVDNTYSRYVTGRLWANFGTNGVHYTEVMSGGHTAEMYGSKKLMQWMFGTRK